MRILGIHDGHNASVCLLEDGKISFAIQEERLTNTKNFTGFPARSLQRTLEVCGIEAGDIDLVAMASMHTPKPFDRRELLEGYKEDALFVGKVKSALMNTPLYEVYKEFRRQDRLNELKKVGLDTSKVEFVDHHLCHAATAYYGAPWRGEPVLVLTNDGSGDGLCATVSVGENGALRRIAETPKADSIGNVYSRTTFMLGFVPLEHEFKLMGMAPYAPQSGAGRAYEVFRQFVDISDQNPLVLQRRIAEPTGLIYPRLRKECELLRFDWICAGLQKALEDVLVRWVRNCIEATDIHKVALAGGVFMNVKVNKLIMEMPEVEDVFVFPSCSDDTTSIGAAFWTYVEACARAGREADIEPIQEFYLGDSFSNEEVRQVLESTENEGHFSWEYREDIENAIAELLAAGEIVARCKGRMEFGARALGNRSILADASDLRCVRIINAMIKNRDFWMPFAPAVLKERESDYIINPKGVAAPYMILSFDSTDRRDEYVAAVHQADFTARPQLVDERLNPEFYRILKRFEALTGKGVVLNTSFNLHGYPIVHGPRAALWVFKNSGLKYLALGDYLLFKTA